MLNWTATLPWLHSSVETVVASLGSAPDPLVVVTTVSDRLASSVVFTNFLYTLSLHGFTAVVALDVPPLLPSEAEVAVWLRRELTLRDALARLPPHAVVLLTDGTDVLSLDGPSAVKQSFAELGHAVVFAAEALCDTPSCRGSRTHREQMRRKAPCRGCPLFLNAGGACGRAGALAALLTRVIERMRASGLDDQAEIVAEWLDPRPLLPSVSHPSRDGVTIDYDGRIFGVVPPSHSIFQRHWTFNTSTAGTRLVSLHSGRAPSMVHLAGMRWLTYHDGSAAAEINPCQAFLASVYNTLSPPAGLPQVPSRLHFSRLGMARERLRRALWAVSAARDASDVVSPCSPPTRSVGARAPFLEQGMYLKGTYIAERWGVEPTDNRVASETGNGVFDSLVSPSGAQEMTVNLEGQLCVLNRADMHTTCWPVRASNSSDVAPTFLAFGRRGYLCVYRGSGPFDNRAKVWCQTLHRCQGRMCRLQLGDDGVLKALLGDLHVWSLAFSYEAPQYKVITAPERLPERNGAGIPIRQGLESGWALQQGLVLLASDGHHCAFISQEGRLCNARWNISNGGCTVAAECHPRVLSLSAKKRSLLRAPVYSLLLDSFDGQLRMTMEDASTTKVERYELWSIALEPCALASCALMPTSGGDITVSRRAPDNLIALGYSPFL
ncbi:hypothetical protein AB1Y20_004364 [Prymnesium parvum]|uniref:Uncharacterized protein n=1 Tax=Prymnesium parvum TaxID=97485 RepID=A0AB34IWG0_PRYPA